MAVLMMRERTRKRDCDEFGGVFKVIICLG